MPSSAALDGPRQLIEYRPTGVVPERMTPQREKALAALEGRQGTVRELADHAGVSDSVMRGLVNAGALEAGRGRRRPAPAPPRSAISPRPSSTAIKSKPRPASSPRSAKASIRCCSTESPARARPRSISRRSPSACGRTNRRWSCCPRSRSPSRSSSASRRASAARRWPGTPTCARRSAAAPGARSRAARRRSRSARARPCSCPIRTSD